MTNGDLPPSSSATFFTECAASSATRLPARVEPVNDTMSTSGCAASASPTTGPSPLTRLNTPGRKADLVHDLGEDERVDRRDLRRLEHHGAAGRERVGDLRADLVQRVVPRRDATDDADGLADDEPVRCVSSNAKVVASSAAAENPEMPPPTCAVSAWCFGMPTSWAMTAAISSRPRFECVGDATQELAALGGGLLGPPGERGLRRRDGAVDVGGVAGGDGGEALLGGGVDHLERAAPGGRDPRTVDIEAVVLVHESAGYVTTHHAF